MKIAAAFIILFVSFAHAEPFLTSDPQEGVTKHQLTLGGVVTESDALEDGAAYCDLVNAPLGKTNAELRAGAPWTIDDEDQLIYVWSDPRPFVLGRPGVYQLPTGLSLKNNH